MRVDEITAKRWAADEYEIVCLPHLLIVVCHNSCRLAPTVKPKWAYVFRGPRDMTQLPRMCGNEHMLAQFVVERVRRNHIEAKIDSLAHSLPKGEWARFWLQTRRDILADEGMPGLTDDASFYRVDKNFTEAYSILQDWYQNEIAPVSA